METRLVWLQCNVHFPVHMQPLLGDIGQASADPWHNF